MIFEGYLPPEEAARLQSLVDAQQDLIELLKKGQAASDVTAANLEGQIRLYQKMVEGYKTMIDGYQKMVEEYRGGVLVFPFGR